MSGTLAILMLLVTTAYAQSTPAILFDSTNALALMAAAKNYNAGTRDGNVLSIVGMPRRNFVTKADVNELIQFVDSKEKCRCMVNVFSSYKIPNTEYATVGGMAMDLIEAYRNGTGYPDMMVKCPKTDNNRALELKQWWARQKHY